MPNMIFNGSATWTDGTECELTVKGNKIATVSPPPEFGGKAGYCDPEEIFAASLASCMNTIFILVARNSQIGLSSLETKAGVTMNIEGLEKLVFTHIHFTMDIGLEIDTERERTKAEKVYQIAQNICPLRQSWGEDVPITFELNYVSN